MCPYKEIEAHGHTEGRHAAIGQQKQRLELGCFKQRNTRDFYQPSEEVRKDSSLRAYRGDVDLQTPECRFLVSRPVRG